MSAARLKTEVIAPEGTLYEGEVLAVSGTNKSGPFAILPHHANFISILYDKIILHEERHKAQEIMLEYGIMFCKENIVRVYIGAVKEPAA